MLLNVINSKKYCHESIGIGRPIGNTFQKQYWYWCQQYFLSKVLLLVLAIVFISIVNIPG